MITGTGIDIVEIVRIERSLEKFGQKFAERILTPTELAAFEVFAAAPLKARYLAKRFAMKEAASKALGTGIGQGVSWQDFTTFNNDAGAPQLQLAGVAKDKAAQLDIVNAQVSVSDEQNYVVAMVMLESR